MLPVLLLLAGAAITAPVGLTASSEFGLAQNPETLSAYVREYYADTPILAEIAKCESHFRHLTADGSVIKNPKSSAIGVMQIMSSIHDPLADDLGLDITSLEGNLAYAKHLYETQGTKPWNASRPCWGKYASAR